MNQATQMEPPLKNRSRSIFIEQALFHQTMFLTPSPPSAFDKVIVSQDTFAEWFPSTVPFQR